MALVAITRAAPGADVTAARVAGLGHRPLVAPLLTVEALHPPLPGELAMAQAIVFTSAVTPALVPPQAVLPQIPVFAVGAATAAAARAAGFSTVVSADADGAALLRLVKAAMPPEAGPIWHLGGEALAVDLAAALTAAGYSARHLALYRVRAVETLPARLVELLVGPDPAFVLVHSRAAAEALVRLAPAAAWPGRWHGLCLSPRVAAAFEGLGPKLTVAPEPREEGLLALLPHPTGEHA